MTDETTVEDFLDSCAKADTIAQVWYIALAFFKSRGIEMVSYHLDAGRRVPMMEKRVVTDGFPTEWLCEYLSCDLRLVDPIPELAARLSRPFLWSQTAKLAELTAAQAKYMRRLAASDLGDGIALLVYGPNSRNAFVGLGFGSATKIFSSSDIFELQCAAQIAHLRYCELTDEAKRPVDLSPRELEVLRWMARGKSNSVIAEILGLSRHTIDTIGRRLFEKLDVNDRTTAAIKGIGSGLLSLRAQDVL